MQLQGADPSTVDALKEADLPDAPVTSAERALLDFVRLLTEGAYRTTAADVQQLRDAGWNDQQIAEAVYITALFAMFNRVADAFGLQDPKYFELDPAKRPNP